MFDTRNELLNLMGIVSPMSLIFLDPDGLIAQSDMLDHNRLYMGFELEEGPVVISGTFASKMHDEDEEGWFL